MQSEWTEIRVLLERLARHCRAMTYSLVISRKVGDFLHDLRVWISFLKL
jgi:hypothetical protein